MPLYSIVRPLAQELSVFNVNDYGARGDGVTNDAVAIQQAIAAAAAAGGGVVFFPPGVFYIGATSLTIDLETVVLEGPAAPWLQNNAGAIITYSGNGAAVIFGGAAALRRSMGFNRIQVRATGGAVASATAVGIKLVNAIGFRSYDAVIRDFNSGVGLLFEPTGAGNYGATNLFEGIYIDKCKIGIRAVGTSAVIKDNHAVFLGGAIVGWNPIVAGSIGIDLPRYCDSYRIVGLDIEGHETGVKSDGSNHAFHGLRSEDCTTHVSLTANSTRNQLYGWTPEGTGTFYSDVGTDNLRVDAYGILAKDVLLKRGGAGYWVLRDGADVAAATLIMGSLYISELLDSTDGQYMIRRGTGSPEGVIAANVGALFLRKDGGAGTTLYVKQTGAGNTGWVAK